MGAFAFLALTDVRLVHSNPRTRRGGSEGHATQGGATFTLTQLQGRCEVNTIIADNGAEQCDATANIYSFGHNLETTNTCGLTAAGDMVNTPADLALLADNGGLTQTRALLLGSLAIDAGDDLSAPSTDQRNFPRPIDGDGNQTSVSDIGAYEFLAELIFADDFEIGNTSSWSLSQ